MVTKNGEKPFIPSMRECKSIPLHYSDREVDIGAYMGQYSIRCARFPVTKVTAYEPTPLSYQILTKYKLPNFKPINAAIVGNDRKEVTLHISSGIGAANSTTLSLRARAAINIEDNFPDSLRAIIIDFHPVRQYRWLEEAKEIIIAIEREGFTPVIAPDWTNEWARAGSWMRERDLPDVTNAMLEGTVCCGCGKIIDSVGKSLCINCWKIWSKRHRRGYKLAR